jgi:hypothetical protein
MDIFPDAVYHLPASLISKIWRRDVALQVPEGRAASQSAMDYGFTMVSCILLPQEVGRDKKLLRSVLEPLDLGKWLDLGPRGLRLIPHDPALPPTYFNPDGSVDLVNKGLYLDDVMSHMERIAAALGCQLEWDF